MQVTTITPFGPFKIRIDSDQPKAPFKGLHYMGVNIGGHWTFESDNSYKKATAQALCEILKRSDAVKNITITKE